MFLTQKKKKEKENVNSEVMDMLTGLVVVNISQYPCILGYQVVHLKYIQF